MQKFNSRLTKLKAIILPPGITELLFGGAVSAIYIIS